MGACAFDVFAGFPLRALDLSFGLWGGPSDRVKEGDCHAYSGLHRGKWSFESCLIPRRFLSRSVCWLAGCPCVCVYMRVGVMWGARLGGWRGTKLQVMRQFAKRSVVQSIGRPALSQAGGQAGGYGVEADRRGAVMSLQLCPVVSRVAAVHSTRNKRP